MSQRRSYQEISVKAVSLLLISPVLLAPCFAAVPDPGPKAVDRAGDRAAHLKAAAKFFRLELCYHGGQDKPYYGLTLSVPVVPQLATDPFQQIVQITEDDAVRIIDHLTLDGFLDQAKADAAGKSPAKLPCYTLTVSGKAETTKYHEDLGWGPPMLRRLDGIQAILHGKAAASMDLLLGRLAGHRKEWARQGAK